MKKIAWLTGHSFIDVDEPIVPQISKDFNIRWVIIRNESCWYSEEYCIEILNKNNIEGKVFTFCGKMRSFSAAKVYIDAIQYMRSFDADLYYINYIGVPYLWPFLFASNISNKKIIYPCHDFIDHVGIKNRWFISMTKKMIFNLISNFQFFSHTQQNLFTSIYKKKYSFYAPLALKNFGKVKGDTNKHPLTFLFFGSIRYNKGVDILIEAGKLVYAKYPNSFVIKICGDATDWYRYEKLIEDKTCFEIDIRRVENEEIPELFSNADFLVLPYRDITQSGPLLIAYNYNLPVIASDHDGFKEYIESEKNGFLFQKEVASSLAEVMCNIVENKYSISEIKKNLAVFVEKNCSLDSIVKKYERGFEYICNSNNNK